MSARAIGCLGMLAIMSGVLSAPAHAQHGAAGGEWPTYGGDLGHTRYAALDRIDADNFSDLELAWRFRTENLGPGPEYVFQSTPLMVDGVVYTTAGTRRAAVALDAATGELLWVHRLNEGERGAAAPRRLSGRGLTYWDDGGDGVIFYVTPGYRLIALNARTGRRAANFGENGLVDLKQGLDQELDPVTGEIGLHAAPVVADGVVVIGAAHLAGVAPATKEKPTGHVRGYDARTGERQWIFHTIPGADEFGNDTWLADSWRYTGNTGVWGQMTIDPELGYVYLPVETPTGDLYGGHRPGDNLFSNSIVALDLQTGERAWHFQTIHHDVWDFDLANAPILVDITVDGREVKAVAQPSKQAFLYVLDRATGEPVWPIEERPVPQFGRARRGDRGHPAVPDEAAAVRPAGHRRRRPHRLHPRAAPAGRGDHRAVPHRPALHPAVGRLLGGHPRHPARPRPDRRLELARGVVRPRDRHLLHLLEDRGPRPRPRQRPAALEHGLHHGPAPAARRPAAAGRQRLRAQRRGHPRHPAAVGPHHRHRPERGRDRLAGRARRDAGPRPRPPVARGRRRAPHRGRQPAHRHPGHEDAGRRRATAACSPAPTASAGLPCEPTTRRRARRSGRCRCRSPPPGRR